MWYWFFYVCVIDGLLPCKPFIQPGYEALYETKSECGIVLMNQVNARLLPGTYITMFSCVKTKGKK